MNNSPEIIKLIDQNSQLFWFVPDEQKHHLSMEAVLETIFNYGDINALKSLIRTIGIDQAEIIFSKLVSKSDRSRGNFHELTLNFFTEFFKYHASRNIQ